MAEKKKETKKVNKKEKEVKKTKETKKKVTKTDDSLIVLKAIFCILVVLVVFLGIVAIVKKKEHDNRISANIYVPIVNKEDESAFSVNLRALNQSSEYIIRISNYNSKYVNKKDLKYTIDVQNTTDSKIKLTEYGSNKNLLSDGEQSIIEGGKVAKDKKKDVYYVIKMDTPGTLGKDDYINVKIKATK